MGFSYVCSEGVCSHSDVNTLMDGPKEPEPNPYQSAHCTQKEMGRAGRRITPFVSPPMSTGNSNVAA